MKESMLQLVELDPSVHAVAQHFQRSLAVIRVEAADPLFETVGDLVFFPSEHALPARGVIDLARFDVPVPDSIAGPLDCQCEALPILAQLFLGLLRLRDVLAGGDKVGDLPRSVGQGADGKVDVEELAIFATLRGDCAISSAGQKRLVQPAK